MKYLTISIICLFFIFMFCVIWIGDKPREGSKSLYLGPTKVTQESDHEYQTALQKAQAFESKGQLELAAKEYFLASKINRFCLPSYYPLLQSAKLQISIGNKNDASRDLDRFVDLASEELHPTPGQTFLVLDTTPEHQKFVRDQLNEARQLRQRLK